MSDPLSLTTIYSLLWQAFSSLPAPEIEFTQPGALRSCFAVTDSSIPSTGVWQQQAAARHSGARSDADYCRTGSHPSARRPGAQVLRIDPPDWYEPTLEEEITPGKRCARLNIKTAIDKQRLIDLLCQADVIVHGYRADALDALGFDSETRARLRPGLNAWIDGV
jgi:hypothetical protein